jgi:hypothetical protein
MARYNTAPQTLEVTGETDFTYAFTGGIISLTGTAGYEVTMVSPVFFPGSRQTFYNATDGMITLTTSAGQITGNGVTLGVSVDIPTNSTYQLTSDGANYVLTSALAGTTVFELPLTTNDLLNADGKVELNPVDENIEIKPTGTGIVDISPQSSVAVQPGGTATIRPAGDLVLASSTGTITLGEAGKPTAFPGDLTFTAAGQSINISPTGATSSVTIDPEGPVVIGSADTVTISSDSAGNIDGMNIGATTAGTGRFTTLNASGNTTLSSATASSGTGSGAVVVTGGIGVGGSIYAGSLNGPVGNGNANTGAFTSLTSSGATSFTANTASTNTTTGTLVVTGGIGASGAIYAGSFQGPIGNVSSNTVTATTVTASGVVDITGTTDSSSANGDNGILRVEGGASIAKRVYSGGGFVGSIGNVSRASGQFTTLDANNTVTLSPANKTVTLSPSGTGTVTISPASSLTLSPGSGTISNMSISGSSGSFTSLSASGTFSYNGNGTLGNATSDTHTMNGILNINRGLINLYGTANPSITFNGSSDAGVDAEIRATPEGLDFREPEDSNKVWFQILDDVGCNINVGAFRMGGSDVIDASKNMTSIRCIGVNTADPNSAGQIRATGNIVSNYSDARLKDVQGNIENALEKVCSLNGVIYKVNELAKENGFEGDELQAGLLAQEVQAVLPEVVLPAPFDIAQNEDKEAGIFEEYSASGENYMTVQYERIIPLLVEAIKELKQEINTLKGDA